MNGGTAFCNLCKEDGKSVEEYTLPVEEILLHLRVEHMQDQRVHADGCPMDGTCDCMQPETWPDGEVVIYDESLEPKDFG